MGASQTVNDTPTAHDLDKALEPVYERLIVTRAEWSVALPPMTSAERTSLVHMLDAVIRQLAAVRELIEPGRGTA
jgi:hypothetical protein